MAERLPAEWTDRAAVIRDNPDRNPALIERYRAMSDRQLIDQLERLTVVGIDPGGTTGLSVMAISFDALANPTLPIQDHIHTWMTGQIDCGAQSGNAADSATAMGGLGVSETGEAAGVAIMEHIIRHVAKHPTAVVIEDFIPREQNMSRDFLSPIRVTARLDQLLWELRAVTTHRQQPSEAKTTCTDARLKQWGFFEGGHSDRHARDAVRHCLLMFRKLRAKPSRLRTAFPAVEEAIRRELL